MASLYSSVAVDSPCVKGEGRKALFLSGVVWFCEEIRSERRTFLESRSLSPAEGYTAQIVRIDQTLHTFQRMALPNLA